MKIESVNNILILGIETSTLSGGASITSNGKLLAAARMHHKKTHSHRQLAEIDFLLKSLDLSLDAISAIAVSVGPGSFTGVRIGLSIAKGLSYTLNKPIIGVSCLLSLARQIAEPNAVLAPVIDANRGEVFSQAFILSQTEGNVLPYNESKPFIGSIEECLSSLPVNTILAGNGAERYKEQALIKSEKKFRFAPPERFFPSPEMISIIGYEKFIRGEFDDPALLEPVYLRRATTVIPPAIR